MDCWYNCGIEVATLPHWLTWGDVLIWLLIAIGVVVIIGVLIVSVGSLLPKEYSVSRRAYFNHPPKAIWEDIRDFENQTSWRTDVWSAKRLPDEHGHQFWDETDKRGQTLTFEIVESVPPRRLIKRIVNENLAFGWSWTMEVGEYGEVASLTITENGEVYNPIFRFISRFIIGHASTIDGYLRALGRKLGVEVTITSA
jgi:hypothetical protein